MSRPASRGRSLSRHIKTKSMPRSLSNSSTSTSSNIILTAMRGIFDESVDTEAISTPNTSLGEGEVEAEGENENGMVMESGKEQRNEESGRPKRVRKEAGAYSVARLSNAAQGGRAVSGLSGGTLVEGVEALEGAGDAEAGIVDEARPATSATATSLQRRTTVRDRVKKVASSVVGRAASVLGKRGREAGTDRRQSKLLRELDLGKKGFLDELELEDDYDDIAGEIKEEAESARPNKRVRLSTTVAPTTAIERSAPTPKKAAPTALHKKWQTQGLYCGQEVDFVSVMRNKLQKKRPGSSSSSSAPPPSQAPINTSSKPRTMLPLPMFSRLETERDFVIPFDVFAPSYRARGEQKPKEWTKVNKNRWIDDAKELWRTEKLERSICTCHAPAAGEEGCGDDCWNRFMGYECDDSNCNLQQGVCSNRAFAELTARLKRGNEFDIGVEVVPTGNRGFGIRACRAFSPGQIIMEYSGEVITQEECSRRMHTEYKNKDCYYLMNFEQGMIIDATRGSIARFVNHSCEPNSHMKKLKVGNNSRMALFAGDKGISTGEELTYDYNFDNFGETKQACYCGAATCRGILGPKEKDADRKKREKREREEKATLLNTLKRKAGELKDAVLGTGAEDAQDVKRRKEDAGKPAGWRGWVTVDEVKDELRREKKAREEAEKSSSRAQRLAAREAGVPPKREKSVLVKKKPLEKETAQPEDSAILTFGSDSAADRHTTTVTAARKVPSLSRRLSTGSRFVEDGLQDEIPAIPAIPAAYVEKKVTRVEVPVAVASELEDAQGDKQEAINGGRVQSVGGADVEAANTADIENKALEDVEITTPPEKTKKRPSTAKKSRISTGGGGDESAKKTPSSGPLKGLRQSTLNFGSVGVVSKA